MRPAVGTRRRVPDLRRETPRALVCGTNYGQYYVDALALPRSPCRLVGILARGSNRSTRLAHRLDIPLFRSVEELPDGIDIACVAVGSSASEVIVGLIRRGIHVLCEHPQEPAVLRRALGLARGRGCCLHLNGHFADLPAPARFVACFAAVRRSQAPVFIDLMVSDRALYGGLDILARGLDFRGARSVGRAGEDAHFVTLRTVLGDTETTIRVQSGVVDGGKPLVDGDPGYLLDCRIACGFPAGILTLGSLAGPVYWNRNSNRSAPPGQPIWADLGARAVSSTDFRAQRVRANLEAIVRLVSHARTSRVPPEQARTRILSVSTVWSAVGRLLARRRRSGASSER